MPSGNRRRAIGVISRAPAPGYVKTRLATDLGEVAAASLFSAFLRDVLVNAASLPWTMVSIFHPPGDDIRAFERVCPPGVTVQTESGQGYGEIIPNTLRTLLRDAPFAGIVGADSPGLPSELLQMAFEMLEEGRADVVICPAADGGFCALAVNGDYPAMFDEIVWSSDRVFRKTVENARRMGLRVEVLPEWYDVDDSNDLQWLADDLAADVTIGAAATRQTLRRLTNAGVPVPAGQNPWRVEGRHVIHDSPPWRALIQDRLTTHTGDHIDYAFLETQPAVWVVPVTDDGRVILVRQYRHPVGAIILEVPAGGGTEDPHYVAARELREETGGRARELVPIATYFPSSAHLSHQGHVFLALGVELGEQELESTELLAVVTVPFELALDMARRGEIADSQSALAILACEPTIRATLGHRPGRSRAE